MNRHELYKYRTEIRKQILSDIWHEIHQEPKIRFNHEYLLINCNPYRTKEIDAEDTKREVLNWINNHKNIVKIWQCNGKYQIVLELLNCRLDEFESELDAEIEELETRLKELKEQRKLEKEENRKKEKIEYLKKELTKLEEGE